MYSILIIVPRKDELNLLLEKFLKNDRKSALELQRRIWKRGTLSRKRIQKPQIIIHIFLIKVIFLIYVMLRGGMTNYHILPTPPSYSMHIWIYISKAAGECSFTLGFNEIENVEDQLIQTN